MNYTIPELPLKLDIETKKVLKKLAIARSALAELKGFAARIPNIAILINTLALQEAKDSSEVENIITTHDELFREGLKLDQLDNLAAKEVQNYALSLRRGFDLVLENNLITNRTILEIHQILEENNAGYRALPGTKLMNDLTNEVVYVPPQLNSEIKDHMANLLLYINDELDDLDPLVRMAIIHHQFESIHPFYDGNGRTGRILNILYLIAQGLLNFPILYLSRYINQNKQEYYRLLQAVRLDDSWEEWVLFILEGVATISTQSIALISSIKETIQESKSYLRSNYAFYSQDLLNHLFMHPYTKIELLANDLSCNRKTASSYLNQLAADERGILKKLKKGRTNYYVNTKLLQLLATFDFKLT